MGIEIAHFYSSKMLCPYIFILAFVIIVNVWEGSDRCRKKLTHSSNVAGVSGFIIYLILLYLFVQGLKLITWSYFRPSRQYPTTPHTCSVFIFIFLRRFREKQLNVLYMLLNAKVCYSHRLLNENFCWYHELFTGGMCVVKPKRSKS